MPIGVPELSSACSNSEHDNRRRDDFSAHPIITFHHSADNIVIENHRYLSGGDSCVY
jgi:hypothetical protein